MVWKLLLSMCVAVGMNTPLCSGGVFAAASDAINYIAAVQQDVPIMTYGRIGYLSCTDTADVQPTKHVSKQNNTGCKDAKACLAHAVSDVHTKHFFASVVIESVPSSFMRPFSSEHVLLRKFSLAREGPKRNLQQIFAFNTVQRE